MTARRCSLLVMVVVVACGNNLPGESAPDAAGDDPVVTTYYKHVAPILTRRCVSCHVEDGVAPFALTSYAAASEEAVRIADVTERRIMPPWPADSSGACNTFLGQRWLSEAEIATLGKWVSDGRQAGDPRDAISVTPPPPPPFIPAYRLQSPDSYTVASGPDEYRCFVLDPGLTEQRFITAISAVLDHAGLVHHAGLFSADTAVQRTAIADRDAADPLPGYACKGQAIGARDIGIWSAGDLTQRWPAGTGIPLPAGAHIVLQFHYHNHGGVPVTDRSAIDLELAGSVSSPATIPLIRGYPLDLAPGQPDVVVSSAGLIGIHAPTYARAVRLHMHKLGTHARLELERDEVSTCLLDIPRWDFGWQLFYTFDQPIRFLSGDRLRITCGYDTTSRTTPVTWGQDTDDEMCLGYMYVAE